jgi:hypothetical protein
VEDLLEKFFYEAKPYFALALGLYALFAQPASKLLVTLGLILFFCAGAIMRLRFTKRNQTTVESIFYESQPYLYLGLALYVIFFQKYSKFAVGCALLLLFCTGIIFKWRLGSRKK